MTQSEESECFVETLLSNRYGLSLKKIRETKHRTPDYLVFFEKERIAVLEVKNVRDMTYTVNSDQVDPSKLIWDGSSDDNTENRIADKIHKAMSQLETYSDPKILVFVNDETCADYRDLKAVLFGYTEFTDGSRGTALKPKPEKRLTEDRPKIDLYIWVERSGSHRDYPKVYAFYIRGSGFELYKRYFDPR